MPGRLEFNVSANGTDTPTTAILIQNNKNVTAYADLDVIDDIRAVDYIEAGGYLSTGSNGVDGELRIYSEQGATDYLYTIRPNPAATQNTTLVLPPDDGSSNQVLTTDGSGVLSW